MRACYRLSIFEGGVSISCHISCHIFAKIRAFYSTQWNTMGQLGTLWETRKPLKIKALQEKPLKIKGLAFGARDGSRTPQKPLCFKASRLSCHIFVSYLVQKTKKRGGKTAPSPYRNERKSPVKPWCNTASWNPWCRPIRYSQESIPSSQKSWWL